MDRPSVALRSTKRRVDGGVYESGGSGELVEVVRADGEMMLVVVMPGVGGRVSRAKRTGVGNRSRDILEVTDE